MTHRIVVLGAGYAGLAAATRVARQLRPDEAQVTLVNAAARFVERVRLHQLAAGQRLPNLMLRDVVRGTGVDLVLGRVTSLDPDHHELWIDVPEGPRILGYDTLVYALGSTADVEGGAGGSDHAFTVAGFDEAKELGVRVSALAADGGVLGVIGGGATGIEAATELAETYPSLRVRLLTDDEPGGWLSPRAREHLRQVFARLDIDVHPNAKVVGAHPDGVVLADGHSVALNAVLWATGFQVPFCAREAGLAVDGQSRVLVDDTLRSLSHPDVYAVGDAAAVPGLDGKELRMACATAIPTGRHAADAIASRLRGRSAASFRFRYLLQCLSLGRRDGVVQFVHADDSPRNGVLTGRAAALLKEIIVRGAARTARGGVPARHIPGSGVLQDHQTSIMSHPVCRKVDRIMHRPKARKPRYCRCGTQLAADNSEGQCTRCQPRTSGWCTSPSRWCPVWPGAGCRVSWSGGSAPWSPSRAGWMTWPGAAALNEGVAQFSESFVRDRQIYTTYLAGALARPGTQRDLDAAAGLGMQSIDLAETLDSTRRAGLLRDLILPDEATRRGASSAGLLGAGSRVCGALAFLPGGVMASAVDDGDSVPGEVDAVAMDSGADQAGPGGCLQPGEGVPA